MAISDRMLTRAELQAITDFRATVRSIPEGPASGWTKQESDRLRFLLVRLADLAVDTVGMTAEQHQAKMDADPRYRHFWRMQNAASYAEAWSYVFDPSFRATADGDMATYAVVIEGLDKYATRLEGDPAIVAETLAEDSPPAPTPHPPAFIEQAHFRGYNDDGAASTVVGGPAIATAKADRDTNFSQATGANFRLVFQLINTSSNDHAGGSQLWCQKNAGPWQPVTATAGVARSSASAHLEDGASFSPLLHFVPPDADRPYSTSLLDETDGFTKPSALRIRRLAERYYCLQLVAADLVAGDTVSFQLRRGMEPGAATLLDAYPAVTVVTVA